MGNLIREILKALSRSGGKAKPKSSTSATKPGCKSGCNKLAKKPKPPTRRHDPCKTKGNDPTKEKNSMMDPDLNPADDLAAMNAGQFQRVGEDIVVNGRTYGMHPETGTVFPKSGPGIHQIDRGQHQFLKQLNSQSFDNAMKFANHFPGLDEAKIAMVLDIWRKCK